MIRICPDIIIAIDGYSSCGKSTFAKQIATTLDYLYIDTGAMYRTMALFCIEENLFVKEKIDEDGLINALDNINISFSVNAENGGRDTYLNGRNVEEDIRSVKVSDLVSEVSIITDVRRKMVNMQQDMGRYKRIVMDGRDIGTVVFPNAELKIFMTAKVNIRAERRFRELKEKGINVQFEDIQKNIEHRDFLDENRKESPLKKADDAIILDNSMMTPEEQMQWFIRILEKRQWIIA